MACIAAYWRDMLVVKKSSCSHGHEIKKNPELPGTGIMMREFRAFGVYRGS